MFSISIKPYTRFHIPTIWDCRSCISLNENLPDQRRISRSEPQDLLLHFCPPRSPDWTRLSIICFFFFSVILQRSKCTHCSYRCNGYPWTGTPWIWSHQVWLRGCETRLIIFRGMHFFWREIKKKTTGHLVGGGFLV